MTKHLVLTFVLAAVQIGYSTEQLPAQPDPSARQVTALRIATFNAEILTAPQAPSGNIHKYRFDRARRRHLERVAAVIETLNPDILNLVEVTSRETLDQLVKILHEKGLTDYRGYHVECNDTYTELDVALISRYEPDLIEGEAIRTFFSEANDPKWRQSYRFTDRNGKPSQRTTSISRNCLYFFTIGGHKLAFLGLHLKSNPQNEYANAKRSAEADVAGRILRAEVLPLRYIPIVLGDINDYDADVLDRDETRATSTNVLRKLKDFDHASEGDELVNVAERIVRQSDRFTSHWDWNENGAHDGEDVYTMIDHILIDKQLMPHVKRVFISHSVSIDTSDHYPIVVDLELPVKTGAD
jgi:endonuclease/exonuclease/phosphatase family metal-dependent hydrolase